MAAMTFQGTAPLVSIVVPFYNVGACARACMDSLLQQTFQNYEVVCVDDGSTDGTGRLLDSYAGDPRVRVVHEGNAGVAEARNVGVRRARGAYVSFVDGDDVVSPCYLDFLYRALTETGADVALTSYVEVPVRRLGREPVLPEAGFAVEVRGRADSVEAVLYGKPYQSPWGKLAPRELYVEHPFPAGRYYEDFLAFPGHFLGFDRYAWVAPPLYGYVLRRGSTTKGGYAGTAQVDDYECAIAVMEGALGSVEGVDPEAVRYRVAVERARLYRLAGRAPVGDRHLDGVRSRCLQGIRAAYGALMANPRVPRADKLRFAVLRFAPWAYGTLMSGYERVAKGVR